jgi:hypothetical protein
LCDPCGHSMATGFHEWLSQEGRGRWKLISLCYRASEVTLPHSFYIPFARSKLEGVTHIKGKGNLIPFLMQRIFKTVWHIWKKPSQCH